MVVVEIKTRAAGLEISEVDGNNGILSLRTDLLLIKKVSASASDDVIKSHVHLGAGTEVPISGSDETADPAPVSLSSDIRPFVANMG
jgi:hypothetical protein